jgi:hypothetical protein
MNHSVSYKKNSSIEDSQVRDSIKSQVEAKIKELRESSQQDILQIEKLFKQADRQLENNAIPLDWKPLSDFKKNELDK